MNGFGFGMALSGVIFLVAAATPSAFAGGEMQSRHTRTIETRTSSEPPYPTELQGRYDAIRAHADAPLSVCNWSPYPVVPWSPCGPLAPMNTDPFGFGYPNRTYDFSLPGRIAADIYIGHHAPTLYRTYDFTYLHH